MNQLSSLALPLLPIWLPVLMAPLLYLLRRHALPAAVLASATVGAVGLWLLVGPPSQAAVILGRTFMLTELGRVLLIILAAWLLFAFLYFSRISQGWTAFPVLLVVYGMLAAALSTSELIISVLVLKLAWLVMILLVQGGASTNTRAATRLLVLTVLALPPFLIAATLINQQLYQPDVALPIQWIVLMLGLGFALILAVIPFHAWLPQVAEDGPPLIAAWLVAGMGGSYLVLLVELLGRFPWLTQDGQLAQGFLVAGLGLIIFGGLLAVSESHLGRMWAYVVLIDLGYILIALSFDSRLAQAAALFAIGARLLSLLLAGSALATIRHRATSLYFDDLRGVGSRLPLSILAFGFGSFALVGVPLTAGFPSHWAILQMLAEQGTLWVWAVLAASVLGVAAVMRAFLVMMSLAEDDPRIEQVEPEPPLATAMLVGLMALSLYIGVVPHRVDAALQYLLNATAF